MATFSSSASSTGGSDSEGGLKKATLVVLASKKHPAKGLQPGSPTGSEIEFMFNPNQLGFTRSANWSVKVQKDKGTSVEFLGSQPTSMTVEMFLDASLPSLLPSSKAKSQVSAVVEELLELTDMEETKTPKLVQLRWGVTTYVTALVKSVAVNYTRFRPSGEPIRAVVTLTLEELITSPRGTNPTSGGLQALQSHTFTVGDSLAAVADRELDSPTLWRAVAAFNGIDDPLRVRPGTRVLIPARPETADGGPA